MTHLTLFYFSPIGKQKFYSESIWKTWVKATSVYLNQILIYSPLQLGGLRNWTLGDVGPATCLDVEDIPSQGAQPTFILITQNKASQLGSFDNIDFFVMIQGGQSKHTGLWPCTVRKPRRKLIWRYFDKGDNKLSEWQYKQSRSQRQGV